MSDGTLPFHPDLGNHALVIIKYSCTHCNNIKEHYQRYPKEPENTDHRQWCPPCKRIQQHIRILPDKSP